MKLNFKLLVVDDTEGSAQAAIRSLSAHLERLGFTLTAEFAKDLSATGIRTLTRNSGRDFDLVIIDYNLGGGIDGSDAALVMRRGLPYTDIIFFSSDPGANLIRSLADKEVAGVFVSNRIDLPEALIGVADTIIGKAIDLTHMRGIAMAEVAEMDVLLERVLLSVYSVEPEVFQGSSSALLESVANGSARIASRLAPLISEGNLTAIIGDGMLFSSFQKYKAVRELAKSLPTPPRTQLDILRNYNDDVINNRNILAHAKEERDDSTGAQTLRSVRQGDAPIQIDDAWMSDFRTKLRASRSALEAICVAVQEYVSQQLESRQDSVEHAAT